MSVSEEEYSKIQSMLEQIAPQFNALVDAFKPLEDLMRNFLSKIGVDFVANQVVYLRKRGMLVVGMAFIGPTDVLDKLAKIVGVELSVRGEEKEED